LQADDGPAGLELLRSDSRIDLLVTDIGLPGLNGREVASAARKTRQGLKVLFMTGYAQNALGGDLELDPGMELITKPFAMGALAARVRTIIEAGRPEGSSGANEKRPD
jgi:DNA-binding response OmpR family regulator